MIYFARRFEDGRPAERDTLRFKTLEQAEARAEALNQEALMGLTGWIAAAIDGEAQQITVTVNEALLLHQLVGAELSRLREVKARSPSAQDARFAFRLERLEALLPLITQACLEQAPA